MASTFAPRGPSILVQQEQGFATQRPMPFLGEPQSPELAPDELIDACQDRLDAIRLAVQTSRLSNDEICKRLGMDPGHFTRMMQGRANFPDRKSVELMRVTGSLAPLQFEAKAMGFALMKVEKKVTVDLSPEELALIQERRRAA